MNVLMLCTKFSLDENSPWLTNELADSLSAAGHCVSVIHIDWSQPSKKDDSIIETKSAVRVLTVAPLIINKFGLFFEKLAKWSLSSFLAWRSIKKFTKKQNYQLLIGFSPTTTVALPLWRLLRRLNCVSYLVQWDFFPYHHQQIGLINNRHAFALACWIENKIMRKFNHIGCMSPKNIDYLRSHYDLKTKQKIHILPIWGQGDAIVNSNPAETRKTYALPSDKVLAIFGGQLTKGRGIETILAAAKLARIQKSELGFVFVGAGPLEQLIRDDLEEKGNVFFLGKLSREEYLQIAAACDVGLVCTVDGVDVPTFPSKSIDYFRTKLPILAAVEKTSDYGDFVAENSLGVVCKVGDAKALYHALKELTEKPALMKEMGENGFKMYLEKLHVDKVAIKLFQQALNLGVK